MDNAVAVEDVSGLPRRSLDDLNPFAGNPRTHSSEQVQQIAGAMREFGWTNPILIDERETIIAGHGRLQAARLNRDEGLPVPGWEDLESVPVIVLRGLSEAQKRAYVIADNKLALNSGWDDQLLGQMLHGLNAEGYDLLRTGFSGDELSNLMDPLPDDPGGEGGEGGAGGEGRSAAILEVLDVTLAEPAAKPMTGEVWNLGKHVLIVQGVLDGWAAWKPYLKGSDTLFCPFPNPLVPLTDRAVKYRLVLVQPDPYVAGHLLDCWNKAFPKAPAERQG